MKKARFLSALLALVFLANMLSGCDSEKANQYTAKTTLPIDEMIAESETHQYFRSGDKYYLHYSEDFTAGDDDSYYLYGFDTYEELVLCLTEDFNDERTHRAQYMRACLQSLYGDKNGDIQVLNVNDLYRISHPDYTFTSIDLEPKGGYTVRLNRKEETNSRLNITVYHDKTQYDEAMTDALNFNKSSIKLTDTVQSDDGSVTEFYTTQFDKYTDIFSYSKMICYDLKSNDGKSAHVIETHAGVLDEETNSLVYSENVGGHTVFVEDNGLYYKVYVGWKDRGIPFEEWIFTINMEPYFSSNQTDVSAQAEE